MKTCLVIYNPNSGKLSKNKVNEKFREILLKNDYNPTLIETKYVGHATKIVSESEFYDLVMSVGGDGTFNEVIAGNLKRNSKLLITHIPVGTTNDIGAMLGYEKNIYKNLTAVLSGAIKEMDICTVNGKPFVYVSAFGKFTNVPYDTSRSLKKMFGYVAYLFSAFKSFCTKTPLFELEYIVDGQKYSGLYSFAIITNANRVAGINDFYDNIKLDDGKFEVLISNTTKRKEIVKSFSHAIIDDIKKVPGFEFFKTNEINFKFKKPRPWCLDGEEYNSNELEFSIKIASKVNVLIPKKNIEKLFER